MSSSVRYSVPYAAPAFGPPPYHMVEGQVLLVSYDVDPAAAAASVSPPLSYSGGNTAAAFIGDMLQLPHCGRFHEGGVLLNARYRDLEAPYTPYLWTSTDEAMMVGREVYGMPKILCDEGTPLRWAGNQIFGVIQRRGREIMAIELNIEGRVDPAQVPRKDSRLSVRTIPDPSGETTCTREVLHFPLTDFVVHEAWQGTAMLRISPTAFSRVHELQPVNSLLTGHFLRVSWTLGFAEIMERSVEPAP